MVSELNDSVWYPIVTAPRDGTRVLLFRPEWQENVLVGYWNTDWHEWQRAGAGPPIHEATHWMAIPATPILRK